MGTMWIKESVQRVIIIHSKLELTCEKICPGHLKNGHIRTFDEMKG